MSSYNIREIAIAIKKQPLQFWQLNLLQMFEKLAYWCVLLQMPIYIAQKDNSGGLHWEQTIKGLIFFWWALVQNIVPVFSGGFADRYGYKKMMAISFLIIIISYFLLGTQREFYPFLGGAILLGLGSGVFKPALQGALGKTISKESNSFAWGIYFMLLNLAVFFGPPISKYLKFISWQMVFYGSMAIVSLNFIILFFVKIESIKIKNKFAPIEILKNTFKHLIKPQVFWFVLCMSGFCIVYMQFYETLPNFIYDWVDTTAIVKWLNLPKIFTMETSLGTVISYEWLYNLNAVLILLFIFLVTWRLRRILTTNAIFIGVVLASLGLMVSGFSQLGVITIIGIIIYTFGEMITNPKFTQHLNFLAGDENKSMYLSFLNISSAIGLGIGSLAGGWLYKSYGEKANLATKYITEHFPKTSLPKNISSFDFLQKLTGLDSVQTSGLLWHEYSVYRLWIPFVIIGIISAIGIYYYGKKFIQINNQLHSQLHSQLHP